MPDNIQEPQNQDLLEHLLTEAASRAAKQEAEDALRKGYVTREQINMALDTFGAKLEDTMADKLLGTLESMIQNTVKKALENSDLVQKAIRKGTVLSYEEERESDPVSAVLKKARQNPESLDQTDKEIAWAITQMGLSTGMSFDNREE